MQKKNPANKTAKAAHQVRIIGGQWKRTPLPVIDAEGLRPTPDRVRETVFNWLTHLLDGRWEEVKCLDLFAGTGALGFEAASRGAAAVVMIENHMPALRQLEANKEKLRAAQVSIVRSDALFKARELLADRQAGRGVYAAGFTLIFLDPPYHQDWLQTALPLCADLLAPGGLVYAEAEMPFDAEARPAWLEGWEIVRADKAGIVFYHLLRRGNMPENQA